ncbi:hypothetical protein H6P81_002672 [Aristolochia fimbriata]|uniref:RNase H type-1 domain-containing protein n=1 Tax=Aristolochia fimbriata TaxID=158543 RepID=A0AAV7FC33_ARIFI|nr:hypothetical protein H6P81_002672 [Aristolochia fimbriata]
MYFDGTARRNGVGAGVLLVSLRKDPLPYSFVLTQTCSNNKAEYQAILLSLREFEVKKSELVPFWRYACDLLAQILEASLHYVPRSENGPADALAGIAVSLPQFDEQPNQAPIYERWVVPPPADEEVEEE